jgi:hypothetical protein
MTIGDIITLVGVQMDNDIDTSHKVRWINEMEQQIYRDMIKGVDGETMNLVADQATYSLTGYLFSQIARVMVNDSQYEKLSLDYHTEPSYYNDDGDLVLYPTPITSVTDGLVVFYKVLPTLKTTGGIATETPDLVDEYGYDWLSLYENYLYYKICLWKREFGEANNYIVVYNEKLAALYTFLGENKPLIVPAERRGAWRGNI